MKSVRFFSVFLVFALSLSLFSTQVPRGDTWVLLFAYTGIFGLYVLLLRQKWQTSLPQLLFAAMLVRVAVSTNLPSLSDDYHRFIWDGQLMLHEQMHPYAYTPEQTGIRNDLYAQLNSQRYFTVYPVVCQAVFYLSAFGKFPILSVLIIRTLLLAAEMGTITLIARRLGTQKALWYALNPLVIIEVCGNLHFEGLAVFFLVGMAYTLTEIQSKPIKAALFWALAIATKITPALIAPLLFASLRGRDRWVFTVASALAVVLLFVPIAYRPEYIQNLLSSLGLYFHDFQINASVYYLLNAIISKIKGFHAIGTTVPILSFLTVSMVILFAFRLFRASNVPNTEKTSRLFDAVTLAFLAHLFLSTTVHPWYVLLPFCMAFFASDRRLLLFTTAWTGLIFLSYSHYDQEIYQERYAFLVVEYVGLALVWWWLSQSVSKVNL
jgi:alpha-1,6-mannosyltransferase